MNAQVLSDALWAALAAVALAVAGSSHLAKSRIERPSTLLHRIETHRSLYVALVLGWMWLGWHFFAR
jgi:hypothetical protein